MPVEVAALQSALLDWYDAHARALPWRAPPGAAAADPYRVWLSEVMLQQTTVAAVIPYFERFTTRWPTVEALAAADDGELMQAWAGLGYYARARNLLACARAVKALGGFPRTEAGLRALPGVGAYTAAAVASIAFGEVAVVVDGNIERVMARLFAVATPIPAARPELRAHAATLTPAHRPGDHAQALMDLGATICTPRAPRCLLCPIARWCTARAAGNPEAFPVRAAKLARPVRHGTSWWIEADDAVLLVRRPPRGLLGGMLALPSSDWTTDTASPAPAAQSRVARRGYRHPRLHPLRTPAGGTRGRPARTPGARRRLASRRHDHRCRAAHPVRQGGERRGGAKCPAAPARMTPPAHRSMSARNNRSFA